MSPTKKRRSSSALEFEAALAGRFSKACELCGLTHWCTGNPAPTNSPIKKCRIGIEENTYICNCKFCKKGYKQKTIPVPGHRDLELPGFSCLSSLVVYAFICEHPDCGGAVKYVGSTTQQIQARISSHYSGGNNLVRDHEKLHRNKTKVAILEAYTNGKNIAKFLLSRECYFTNLFQTLASHGKGGLQIRSPHGRRCTTCK